MGDNNTAENDNGTYNVALGSWALYSSNSGGNNIGIGAFAGANNQNGDKNIFIGDAIIPIGKTFEIDFFSNWEDA